MYSGVPRIGNSQALHQTTRGGRGGYALPSENLEGLPGFQVKVRDLALTRGAESDLRIRALEWSAPSATLNGRAAPFPYRSPSSGQPKLSWTCGSSGSWARGVSREKDTASVPNFTRPTENVRW